MIWNEAMECMAREDLAQLQRQRLCGVVERAHARVPCYRHRLDKSGVDPTDVKCLSDLRRLPFMSKADFRDHYPFGLFAVPIREVVRIHASTGTTGKPTIVGYTRGDLETWAELCARCLALAGARPGQVFQNAYGYGLFTGGLGMHYGAERLGLTVIPASGGNTARQILLMKDLGTEVLACTPSYALTLADALAQHQIGSGDLKLKTLILGAEPWTEAMRCELEDRLDIDAVDIYGLSEVMGPGVANECVEAKAGAHIFEDHFLVEVIDPRSLEPVGDGITGELVFTTLTKEALPVIRYRTGDLASVTNAPCVCGRTHARMSRVVGRTDDMLIIRGVNVFPSQIAGVLADFHEISTHHQVLVTRDSHRDALETQAEVSADFFQKAGGAPAFRRDGGSERLLQLEKRIARRLHEVLGLHAIVTVLAPNQLPRSEGGKLQRVIDRRKC
jgi:phenylacetate-CoA ligase